MSKPHHNTDRPTVSGPFTWDAADGYADVVYEKGSAGTDTAGIARITLARPAMRPPVGITPASMIPVSRATGSSVESGFTATAARTSGLNDPISLMSRVARTDEVSVSPSCVWAANSPGYT